MKYDVTLEISVRLTETVEANCNQNALDLAKEAARKKLDGSSTHRFGRIDFLDWEIEELGNEG